MARAVWMQTVSIGHAVNKQCCCVQYHVFHTLTLIENESETILNALAVIDSNGVFFSTKKCALYLKKCNFVFVS